MRNDTSRDVLHVQAAGRETCKAATDCGSGACFAGVCKPPTCAKPGATCTPTSSWDPPGPGECCEGLCLKSGTCEQVVADAGSGPCTSLAQLGANVRWVTENNAEPISFKVNYGDPPEGTYVMTGKSTRYPSSPGGPPMDIPIGSDTIRLTTTSPNRFERIRTDANGVSVTSSGTYFAGGSLNFYPSCSTDGNLAASGLYMNSAKAPVLTFKLLTSVSMSAFDPQDVVVYTRL